MIDSIKINNESVILKVKKNQIKVLIFIVNLLSFR